MRNDADVVSAPRDGRTISYRNVTLGAVLVLLGIGGLVAGISTHIIVGIVGFLLMLGGVVLAATPTKADPTRITQATRAPRASAPSGQSFMDRMNERWDRRQGGDR